MRHVGRIVAAATAVILLTPACSGNDDEDSAADPACSRVDDAAEQALMDEYAARSFRARQVNEGRTPASVSVDLPPIRFTGPGEAATLPVGPCQHIYRFAYPDVRAPGGDASPFRYVEIDWNTEGLPRGPNGSFLSAHFDFHFYLRPADEVAAEAGCVLSTNGKTCDPLRTDYAQMARFLDLPSARFIPDRYGPDVDSSIPEMGLHLLDSTADYSVDAVNHNPVLLYGTFAGRLYFAEASVTLVTLQDAMDAPGRVLRFPFRRPRAVRGGLPWPGEFVIRYEPGRDTFRVGFEDFEPPER
jgi:hypothetical protein